MKGLLRKITMEVRWPVLLFGFGLAVILGVLTALVPRILRDMGALLGFLPWLRPIFTAMMGMDPQNLSPRELMQAFLWVHPTVLSIIWAHELMFTSRIPAGEIDRGTVDFLLGLPISRWKLYLAETTGFLLTGVTIIGLGYSGHLITTLFLQPDMRPQMILTVYIVSNLLAVYLAVGGLSFLVSSFCDRRGKAIGVMFAMLLISFLLNFLAQFWEPAKTIAVLSIMEYYRPAIIIQEEAFATKNVLILVVIGLTAWIAGGVVFRRRSVCTV